MFLTFSLSGSFSLSDREVGVFYHFITLRYILFFFLAGGFANKAFDVAMSKLNFHYLQTTQCSVRITY